MELFPPFLAPLTSADSSFTECKLGVRMNVVCQTLISLWCLYRIYRKISNIRHTKSQNLKHFRLVFAQSIGARC